MLLIIRRLSNYGTKVNPIGYRIGVNKDWDSRWYAEKDYSTKLINDIKIREYIEKILKVLLYLK